MARKNSTIVKKKVAPPKVSAEEALKDAQKYGFMIKLGGHYKTWKRRLCVLNMGHIYYYKNKSASAPKGVIPIAGLQCILAKNYPKPNALKIIAPSRTYIACCETEEEAEEWVKAITEAAKDTDQMIYVVDSSGQDQTIWTSLLEAYKEAKEGTQIVLRPGKHEAGFVIDKDIEIRGVETSEVIVTAKEVAFQYEGKNQMSLSNLTIVSSSDAVIVKSGKVKISNCDIFSRNGSGIRVVNKAEMLVDHSTIHDCKEAGIIFGDQTLGTVERCIIKDNEQSGIHVKNESTVTIIRNKISNTLGCGIYVESKNLTTIGGNTIKSSNEGTPISIKKGCQAEMSNNDLA